MFKRNWKIISLAILGAVFFVVYLYLYLPKAPKYPNYLILNQPDESINYFFIRELALNNRFGLPEPLSGVVASQVHPRSTTVVHGAIVPIGFPGVIVFFGLLTKLLVKIFGIGNFNLLAAMLTPLIAAITPLFFYGFLRRIWDDCGAWLSAALLFILPPWWYYASRPFQHNTLLVFLIVAGIYCYAVAKERGDNRSHSELACLSGRQVSESQGMPKRVRHDGVTTFLSGLFLGLAVYVRPSEILWLSIFCIYGLVMARRRWQWRDYVACGVGLALTAILFFTTQTAFYGSAMGSGYVRPAADGSAGIITSGPQGMATLKAIFLPFGFHPVNILRNFWNYFFNLFGVWAILAVAGWGLAVTRCRLGAGFTIMAIFLLIFYGSWDFYDNLLRAPSIGTSYVRYFMPIYVLGLPFLSFFLLWLWQKKIIFKITAVILFLSLLVNSIGAVFAPLEGLSAVKATVAQYDEWREKIYVLTENNAIIVTRYSDKYLFPGRKIIPGWELAEQKTAIVLLARQGWPVYLYDLKLTEKEERVWQEFLLSANLKLSLPLAGWENLELRKIE
ncbi:MAG: hypothetical protein AAB849_01150 [Patescibacteria group bacterium]